MQLIDLLTTAIALFGAAYFLLALAAHLHFYWGNPPIKPITVLSIAPAVEQFDLMEIIDPAELLTESTVRLLPAASVEPLHPFEMSLETMPAIEPIAALQPPAVEVAPHIEPDALIDYQGMSSQQLRKLCGDRGIKWRGVKDGKHLSKPEMFAALTA